MRKGLSLFLFFILLMTLTGCHRQVGERIEISKLEFVRAIAIDTADGREGNIRITLASQRVQKGGGGGSSEQKSSVMVYSEGKTVFEAINNFCTFLDRRIFLGHLEYVLIGEEAAKKGIYKHLDFFSRDHEARLNMKVFVVESGRAGDVIQKGKNKDMFVFDRLEGLIENQGGQSVSNLVDLTEVMHILDMKYLSLYIPCIRLIERPVNGENNSENNKDTMDIEMSGFAVFEGDKLAGYLDGEIARGLNWVRNKVRSGTLVVKTPKGNDISLEIIDAASKMALKTKNGELRVTVRARFSSNIGEILNPEDIFDSRIFEYLKEQQERKVKEEILGAIAYAQEMKLDFLGVGNAFYHQYPIQWEDTYEKAWPAMIPEIKFNVIVESKINRSYDTEKPNAITIGG